MRSGEISASSFGDPTTQRGVVFSTRDGIATVTLNLPESRNALSMAANERLAQLWDEIDADEAVRVAVLTSADCGVFCAGMDLKEAARVRLETGRDILEVLKDPYYERMREVRKPLIAAMTGNFAAGGMVLAMNCDLRVGLGGTWGSIPEARMGRGSPWAVPLLWTLPQAILLEMTLTAMPLPVERLHSLGFVNYVEASPDAVRAKAYELAVLIRDNAPLSVAAAKASFKAGAKLGAEAGLDAAKRLHESVYRSLDAVEGPRAFVEKRMPNWLGR